MTLVIAHRGASAAYPENTVEAFRGAMALGADWVELDARRTADGAVAVLHDAALPDGRLLMDTLGSDLDPAIPTLAQALDACEGMGVNIEIKNWSGDPDYDPTMHVATEVVAEVRRRHAHENVLVSCFDLGTVDAVRALDAGIPTAFLVLNPIEIDVVAITLGHGHGAVHPWAPFVDEDLIDRAHAAGLLVNTWTVDDPDRIAELARWGVDGIVTNVPDIARAALPA